MLATGSGLWPRWPQWAESLDWAGGDVWHVFDDDFDLAAVDDEAVVGIVGLGISAVQLAICLSERENGGVEIIAPHEVRTAMFDSDPCWLGPRCQVGLRRFDSYVRRRKEIDRARRVGTVPRTLVRQLTELIESGEVRTEIGSVESAGLDESGSMEIRTAKQKTIEVDNLILEAPRADRSWLTGAIARHNLETAPCGFPIVDDNLCWDHGLYVSGSLAELELGPASRNIAGARMTARRLKKNREITG